MSDLWSELGNRQVSHLTRWHTRPTHHNESLAEHQWYTAYYSYVLGTTLNEIGIKVHIVDLLLRAMVHDMAELVTGDIPGHFKRRFPEAKESVGGWTDAAVSRLFSGLPAGTRDQLRFYAADHDDNSIEHQIMKAADKLGAFTFARDEVEQGNNYFTPIVSAAAHDFIGTVSRFSWWVPLCEYDGSLRNEMDRCMWGTK